MATPTLKTQPVTIELTYHFDTKTISFPDNLRSKKNPKNLKVEPGDALNFTCQQGSLDLLLSPAGVFEPTEFKTDGKVKFVRVMRAIEPGEEAMIDCGGTFKYKKGLLGQEEIITINPATDGYGVTPET
jgi:hypothetical protein